MKPKKNKQESLKVINATALQEQKVAQSEKPVEPKKKKQESLKLL